MDNPCKHLVDYKLRYGLSGFKCLQKYIKTTPIGRTSIVKCGNKIPRCSSCDRCEGRLYICLICHAISCKSHALSHTQLECGHNLYVDVERSELYCSLCSDLVYDPDFDNVVVSKTIMDIPCNNSNHSLEYVLRRSCKRRKRRLDSMVDLDLNKAKRLLFSRDGKEKSCYPLGLRGLNNLGSTCFMNSILQALVHAPPFRNYFLGDRHDRDSCKKRSPSEHRVCLACEIAVIFSAVFSGDRTPYTPAQFLYSWWQHSVDLACYEQQDAHEFFMSLLDGIHEKEGKERNPCKGNGDCPCIAHRVFSGLLRSDVTCMTCGFTSTTYDPCVDISLNFDLSNVLDTAGKSIRPNNGTADSTLSACLDFFTRPEKLGSDQKLYCQNCHEKRDSLKQMSIRRLPLVLSFHIKRFEHSLVRRTSKKIDWHLSFPFSLDMTPYLSSSIARGRFGNRVFAFETDEADTCAEFEIFAVVTHSGMLESGHYVTYLRLRNEWYKCDDAWITKVDEDVVRAAQCYLLFYVQKMFYYKAYEDFSSTHVSPRRELFHPIAGCC